MTTTPGLDSRATQRAIHDIQRLMPEALAEALNLERITAPLLVPAGQGINDDLNGVERPVAFDVPALGQRVEIVQSLAKWKRLALADGGYAPGEGIWTDMNALRPDEALDELHSVYVDQWDWERVMAAGQRTQRFLLEIVERIWGALRRCERELGERHRSLTPVLPERITTLHTGELAARYPDLSPRERENLVCAEHGAVFLIGIGGALADGRPHDGRAPDYDDWSSAGERGPGLNGDILVWNPVLERAFELSSMGIRVDAVALARQLEISGQRERAALPFHRRLATGELPQTIGGGIGQSRLCMLLLRKRHIGEVQAGVWSPESRTRLAEQGVMLL